MQVGDSSYWPSLPILSKRTEELKTEYSKELCCSNTFSRVSFKSPDNVEVEGSSLDSCLKSYEALHTTLNLSNPTETMLRPLSRYLWRAAAPRRCWGPSPRCARCSWLSSSGGPCSRAADLPRPCQGAEDRCSDSWRGGWRHSWLTAVELSNHSKIWATKDKNRQERKVRSLIRLGVGVGGAVKCVAENSLLKKLHCSLTGH